MGNNKPARRANPFIEVAVALAARPPARAKVRRSRLRVVPKGRTAAQQLRAHAERQSLTGGL
jgi:hypothetical protein